MQYYSKGLVTTFCDNIILLVYSLTRTKYIQAVSKWARGLRSYSSSCVAPLLFNPSLKLLQKICVVYSYVTEGNGTSLLDKLCELTVPLATELMTLLIGGYQTSFFKWSSLFSKKKREKNKRPSKSELLLFTCICRL